MTTDGMTLAATREKYYDFFLHYFDVSTSYFASSPVLNYKQEFFMQRYNGPATAGAIQTMFSATLTHCFNCDLDSFTANMTWVTDCGNK